MNDEPDARAVAHSNRFRTVANRYPLRVTEAYGGDIAAAGRDTDEQVARRVTEWEQAQGITPRDWAAIGRRERGPEATGGDAR